MRRNCRISVEAYTIRADPAFPESQRERPPDGRSAHGTESRKRSSGQPCGRTSTEDGSPPCSPQMPSLMSGRVCLPSLAAICNELADAVLVQAGERIRLVDLLVVVRAEELGRRRHGRSRRSSGSGRWCRRRRTRASLAISSAVTAARGISIMVPTFIRHARQPRLVDDLRRRYPARSSSRRLELLDLADQRDHDFGTHVAVGMLLLDVRWPPR